jgi:hypothetical protein
MGFFSKASYRIRSKQHLSACFKDRPRLRAIGLEALEYCLNENGLELDDRTLKMAEISQLGDKNITIGDFVYGLKHMDDDF